MDDKIYIIQLFFKHNQSPSLTRRAFRNQKGKKCTNAKLKEAHFYGMTSVRKIPAHADVSVSTSSVYKTLKSRKFYPYRPTNVQALSEADFEERVKFSNLTLDKFEEVLNSVLWTDESKFYLTPKAECLSGAMFRVDFLLSFPVVPISSVQM